MNCLVECVCFLRISVPHIGFCVSFVTVSSQKCNSPSLCVYHCVTGPSPLSTPELGEHRRMKFITGADSNVPAASTDKEASSHVIVRPTATSSKPGSISNACMARVHCHDGGRARQCLQPLCCTDMSLHGWHYHLY